MGEHTQNLWHVMASNTPSIAVDQFQHGVKNTLKAMQFAKFESEE